MEVIKRKNRRYKLLIAISYSIKSLSVALAGYEYMNDKKDISFVILGIGAVANEVINIINFISKDE